MSDSESVTEENEAQLQPVEAPKPEPKKIIVPPATGYAVHVVSASSFVPVLSNEERAKMQKEMRELQMAVTSRSLSVYIEEGRAAQVERILCNNGGLGSVMNSRLPCGEYPLTLALRCKQWGVVDLLLQQERIDMNVVGLGGESALLMAVKEAEASRFIRPMIAKGAKIDATDAQGNGIMDICIQSLNYVTMQLLVSIGLKTNFSSHWAPLWMFAAVAQDDSSCLKVLLQQLAVPTVSNSCGVPVLLDAIARKAIRYSFLHFTTFSATFLHLMHGLTLIFSCAQVLINAGADVNATAPIPVSVPAACGVWQFGNVSSLQLAASQVDEDLVLQLLRAGADPCRSFTIPIKSSLCTNDLSSSTFGHEVEDWQLVSPLVWAVKYRKVATVKHLLSQTNQSLGSVDVNAIPHPSPGQSYPAFSSSWTPLMWAIANLAEDLACDVSSSASSNHSESAAKIIFELLMKYPGVNVNAGSTCEAATPLSLAAAFGLRNVVQLLVDASASILETTSLYEATSFAHPHCLELICALIIERNSSTISERSRVITQLVLCLDVSARLGLLDCAQILASTSSDLLKQAINSEDADSLNAEWEKGLSAALLQSCAHGQPHLNAFLQPVTLYSPSVMGLALRSACKNGDATSCEMLLCKGANADWVDATQQKMRRKAGSRTAVSTAFKRWGRTGIIEYEICCSLLLNSCGSSAVNVRDSHGSTPLKWAAIRGHLILLRSLLDKGADVFAEDSDGNSPISYAVMHGHSSIVCELVDREPQLYKARIKVPAYFKVYESGLLQATVPVSSRLLHFDIFGTAFEPKIRTQVPDMLGVRSFQDIRFVKSLSSCLVSAHHHDLVTVDHPESLDVSYIREHLNILKIRDIASSCPDIPLPVHVCNGDIISEVARIGMRTPMIRLIRAATTIGKGVQSIRSLDGDSLLLLCSGHNWRDEVALIIESGCPVDIASRDDPLMTAIIWASHKGHSDIVCDLIQAGSRQIQNALLIATSRCHVNVLDAVCRLLSAKPASQLPDTSCAMLIAAAHGSAAAISALASISPVPEIIADMRSSCIKALYASFSPAQAMLSDSSQKPVVSLIERDPKHVQCFRWLLPGAFQALLHHQFEQRAIQKELEWESSETVIMGFNFKNKLMHAHQNLNAMFGSEDWTHRLKLTRASLLSSVFFDSRPTSRDSECSADQNGNFNVDQVDNQDITTSNFPHADSFFVSENVTPLICINDDGLKSIQTRRQRMQSSYWQGITCSLQFEYRSEEGHSINCSSGQDLSDVTWMLLIPDTTPLHMAAASGKCEAVRALLSLKRHHHPKRSIPILSFSTIDSSGLTPLCYAARFADTNMCALLLDEGADVKPWEQTVQHTMLWLSNRRRWKSLLSALVSINAATGDLPLLPHSSESVMYNPSNSDERDGLVCVPCILWAALSGSEAKTRLLVEAGADADNALAWIQTVGFGYCQENSAMHRLAVKTMSNSQDYVLMGPYAPTARAGDETEGIQAIPSVDSFHIGSYKRHEVPPGHRVQVVAAIIGWNDWSLRKVLTFHDIPQDHYAVTASNSGKSQQLPGKPDLIQAVQLHVDEFICEAVVVIGANYILGIRFTTNQRVLPWMGRNWGDDECKIQRVIRCTPQGREICGFFGLKASNGHGRLLHLGFVARLRGSSDCMRRHRQGVKSSTEEWVEPVKAFSMEEIIKSDIKEGIKGKVGTTPRSNTPWMRSPLPGRTHSPFPQPSASAALLKDFENSEQAGAETAVMNHVWTESPKKLGGSKSKFIASHSSPPSSPARLRTSLTNHPHRLSTRIVEDSSASLPCLNSSTGSYSAPTSPLIPTESAHRKVNSKKKDTM
jgi:ankyrin repeat protein